MYRKKLTNEQQWFIWYVLMALVMLLGVWSIASMSKTVEGHTRGDRCCFRADAPPDHIKFKYPRIYPGSK